MCKGGYQHFCVATMSYQMVACLTHAALSTSVVRKEVLDELKSELQVLAPVSCAINPWVHYLLRALIRSAYYF